MAQRPHSEFVERKVRDIIAAATAGRVRPQDLRPEQTLTGHLGLTSLAIVAMLFQFEEAFQVDIGSLDLDPAMFRTVGSVIAKAKAILCEPRVAARAAPPR